MVASDNNQSPINARDLVREISSLGLSISSGSACSSNIINDNNTLYKMGYDKSQLKSGLRLSLGNWLDIDDINKAPNILLKSISSL